MQEDFDRVQQEHKTMLEKFEDMANLMNLGNFRLDSFNQN
jgi:hypothetical protein